MSGTEWHELPDRVAINYRYSFGGQSPFFLALRDDRKVLGARCGSCGTVWCPPRTTCSKCHQPTQWVQVGDEGTVAVSTVVWYSTSQFVERVPYAVAYVLLDGASTATNQGVFSESLTPEKVRPGARVRAVFKARREGKITDFFFVPVDEHEAWVSRPEFEAAAPADLSWLAEPDRLPRLEVHAEAVAALASGAGPAGGDREAAGKVAALADVEAAVARVNGSEKARAVLAAEDWSAAFQFDLSSGESFHVVVSGGEAGVGVGRHPSPTVVVAGSAAAVAKASRGEGDFTHAISREEVRVQAGKVADLIRWSRALSAARR
ncbi:MAG: hypothetical protein Kow0069_18430 [Promethearchaeota archaeon]